MQNSDGLCKLISINRVPIEEAIYDPAAFVNLDDHILSNIYNFQSEDEVTILVLGTNKLNAMFRICNVRERFSIGISATTSTSLSETHRFVSGLHC